MCYLVGVDVLDVLQRGAGMVDLVEVAAVQIARGLGYELLLVEERGGVLVIGKGRRVEHIARSIVDGELGKGERVRGGQAQVLALDTLRRLLGVLVRIVQPLEEVSVALLDLAHGRPVFPVLGDGEVVFAGVQAAEPAQLADLGALGQPR